MRANFLLLLAAVALSACDTEKHQPVNIAVHPSIKVCSIDETPMACEKLGAYLRDTMKVAANREITVSYAGTESVEKGDTSVEQIAELIKATGYKNVRAVRYDMK
jgi:hypothetical protein